MKYEVKCHLCNNIVVYSGKQFAEKIKNNKKPCLICKMEIKYGVKYNRETHKWVKSCPSCNTNIIYKNKGDCFRSKRENSLCKSCSNTSNDKIPTGVTYDENIKKWCRICPKCKSPTKHANKFIAINCVDLICNRCRIKNKTGHPISDRIKKILSTKAKSRWKNDIYRNKLTPHFRYIKNKNLTLKRISFNIDACTYLDILNTKLKNKNIFFRHQKNNNNGEFSHLCYFADGYDEKNNIWFEYDEPYHEFLFIKKKDRLREKRLIGNLKCKFLRYSVKYDILYEILPIGTCQKYTDWS